MYIHILSGCKNCGGSFPDFYFSVFSDFYFWNRNKIVHESCGNRKKKSVPKRKKKTVPPAGWRLAGGRRHILLKETPGVATVKIVLKTY